MTYIIFVSQLGFPPSNDMPVASHMDAWSRQDFDAETPRDRVVLMPEIPTQLVPSSPSRRRGNSFFFQKKTFALLDIQKTNNSVMPCQSCHVRFFSWALLDAASMVIPSLKQIFIYFGPCVTT